MDWSSLKVAELKKELKSRGLAQSGKKAELVARLEEYESAQGGDAGAAENTKEIDDVKEAQEEGTNVRGDKKQQGEEHDNNAKKEGEDKAAGQIFKNAMSELNDKKRKSSTVDDTEAMKKPKTQMAVPESTSPGSRALLVVGFQRPFTLQAARALLEEPGQVVAMWMPMIKDRAYVTYATVAEAEKARQALWGTTWPANSTKTLEASFISVCEAERAIRKGGGNPDFAIERTEEDPEDEPLEEQEEKKNDVDNTAPQKDDESKAKRDNNKEAVDVANLFRSTRATPMIYWTTCKPFTPK